MRTMPFSLILGSAPKIISEHTPFSRAQLETTIVKSAEMINDSVKLRDEKIVQALLDQGKAAQKEVQE